MKVLVCGSRDWNNIQSIEKEFKKLPQGSIIIHGACPTGADAIAEKLAMKYGFPIRRYAADWDKEGKSAGPKRNSKMIKSEHVGGDPITIGLAFTHDLVRSRGTKDCVEKARKAGIKMMVISE